MAESRQHSLANRMKWAARVIGLIAVVAFLALLIEEIIREGWYTSPEPVNVNAAVILFECIALAGTIISWWRELLAVILLVVACEGLSIQIGLFTEHSYFLAWFMISFPYLVAAMLLFYSWRLSRRTA